MSLAVLLATALATALISGKVVDDANKPLAGVSVAAYPISLTNCCPMYGFTRTDSLGNFKIDVENGVHAVVTSGYSRWNPAASRVDTALGDTASFAGYSAPTLPSKITIRVTSPSGRVRTIAGQANKIGWFYDPGSDFAVDEPGVWKAKVSIVFDGVLPSTSGQLQPPYPTGDVLGAREGEFLFFVVRGGAAQLSVAAAAPAAGQPGAAAPTQFFRPAEGPIAFTVVAPAGLHDLQLSYVTTMPGFILEQGTASGLTYTYDARRLVGDCPNLDLTDGDGFAGADTITISLLLSGTDAAGKRQHFARQVVLQGEELQMPEQKATPATPRRRSVR